MRLVFNILGSFVLLCSGSIFATDSVTLNSETGDTLMIHQFKMVSYGGVLY